MRDSQVLHLDSNNGSCREPDGAHDHPQLLHWRLTLMPMSSVADHDNERTSNIPEAPPPPPPVHKPSRERSDVV